MKLVTLDFETFYDREYSLSKMTTEAYIRDPRFETIGVSIKVGGAPARWYSGDDTYIQSVLDSYELHKHAVLAHNTMFDGAILNWHYNIRPKFMFDTLSMARPLHAQTMSCALASLASYYGIGTKGQEVVVAMGLRRRDFTPARLAEYGAYCSNDVELTHKLFRIMGKDFPAVELRIIDQVLRMFTEPKLLFDRPVLEAYLAAELSRKASLVESMGLDCTEDEARSILMSNQKFAEWLRGRGVAPPRKISKTTNKETYAFSKTDKSFTALLNHEDEQVAAAAAARLGVKSTLGETRAKMFMGIEERGAIPVLLNFYGAHTGRMSGGDKANYQNLPRGGELRKSIVAPPGHVIIACDSSQIEARMLAWLAGQEDLLQAFREGRDIYSEFASTFFGRTITKADKLERHIGKTAILGLGYGMGVVRFVDTLASGAGGVKVAMLADDAARLVRLYRTKYKHIPHLWYRCGDALGAMTSGQAMQLTDKLPSVVASGDTISLPNGMAIRYPLLTAFPNTDRVGNQYGYASDRRMHTKCVAASLTGALSPDDMTRIYSGKVVENLDQALSRIVVAEQSLRIAERYPVVLQVHDENVIVVPEDMAEEASVFMVNIMSTPPVWAPDLPVACEVNYGKSFYDCK